MTYLIVVIVSLALFTGFIGLTSYEARTGSRFFAPRRERLDRFASKFFFVITHVDFWSFIQHLIHQIGEYFAHEIAHLSLIATRYLERLLTRAVKALRARRQRRNPTFTASKNGGSSFVRSISDFKQRLRDEAAEVLPKTEPEEPAPSEQE